MQILEFTELPANENLPQCVFVQLQQFVPSFQNDRMALNIFLPEQFRSFPVGIKFMGILYIDLVIFSFTDLTCCYIVIISVGISVPGEILSFSIDRSVSAAEYHLPGDYP